MMTPYGELNIYDIYVPADGSDYHVQVIDLNSATQEALIKYSCDEPTRWIDWWKLMAVRYTKRGDT